MILKWKRRMLTTLGRISIAKALLLSQYLYCFTCIDATESMIKKTQEQLEIPRGIELEKIYPTQQRTRLLQANRLH